MTIAQAVAAAVKLRPGQVSGTALISEDDLVGYLSQRDMQIDIEIIQMHADTPDAAFVPYDPAADGYDEDADLLVPFPYDKLYVPFLLTQIDAAYDEAGKYNNSLQRFRADMDDFEAYYNRKHLPLQNNVRKLGNALDAVVDAFNPLDL